MKSMKELFKKKTGTSASAPVLELDEEDLPQRTSNRPLWIAGLAIVAAIALIIASMPTASKESVSVNSRVLSGTMHTDTISTVLSGAGTLAYAESEVSSIPANVTVTAYHVRNGDAVKKGDVLASVDKVEVNSAIVELQEVMDELDSDLNRAKLQHPNNLIESKTPGRIKIIYAEPNVPVADTMYEHGALMVMSLDGNMSFQLEAPLTIGDIVDVTMADGTVEDGRVFSYVEGVATILVPDDTAAVGEQVTASAKDGTSLGTGTLEIHSPLKITGLSGTVTDIHANVNMRVSAYAPLIRLKDTGDTLKYRTLLEKRGELEKRMAKLVSMTDGTVEAEYDGIVTAVNKDIDFIALEPVRAHSLPTPGIALTRQVLSGGMHSVKRLEEPDVPDGGEPKDPPDGEDPDKDPEKPKTITGIILGIEGNTMTVLDKETGEKYPIDLSGMNISISVDGMTVDSLGSFAQFLTGQTVSIDTESKSVTISISSATLPVDVQKVVTMLMKNNMMGLLGGFNFNFSGFGGFGGLGTSTPVYETYSMDETDVLKLIPQKEMTVTVAVDELDILTLEEGMTAAITLDALKSQSFIGTLTHISPVGSNAGGNTKYDVEFTLPQTEQMLEGMSASVTVITDVSEPVSLIPAAALQEQSGKTYVYTAYDAKNDELGNLVEVKTGISDGEMVQILSGLDENTTFYYRYADSLKYDFSPAK